MTWDSYKPLSSTPRLRFTNEFDLLMGDSLGKVQDDGSYTSYHIANIRENEVTATLWNYTTEAFETVAKDELRTWRKNDTPLDAVLSIHQFTITDESGGQVGLKLHGSAIQSKETVRFMGRDDFSYCLRIAIRDNIPGNEITEPYYADTSVKDDDYYEFETKVKTELTDYLKKETPLTETQAIEIIDGVMNTIEHNAEHRVGFSTGWSIPKAVKNRLTNTMMEGEPDGIIQDFSTDFDTSITNQSSIMYHPLTE